jgi:Ankyrin repeats (3 copies)
MALLAAGLAFVLLPVVSIAEVSDKNRDLILASMKGNLTEVIDLLNNGANVNAKDQKGWTALEWALRGGKWTVVKALLERGAIINGEYKLSRTTVVEAAETGNLNAVRALLDKGVKVKIEDKDDYSALIKAIRKDDSAEVKRLLVRDAKITLIDNMDHESCNQPLQPTDISYGLPFLAYQEDYRPKHPEGLSLADPFEPGRTVALISNKGVCTAKTASKFQYGIPGGGDFEATHLEAPKECSGYLAVVGVDGAAIRVIRPSDDQSPLAKDIELEARRVAKCSEAVEHQWPMTDAPPEIVRVGEVTLVRFGRLTGAPEDEIVFFAAVLIINDNIFRLEARCTDWPHFFSVNDKLHLTYCNHCCGCGWQTQLVYDLSSGTPRKVYENASLGD